MRAVWTIAVGVAALLAMTSVPAHGDSTRRATADPLLAAIQKARLDNGLRVVMTVDRSAPSVAVCATYDVGTKHGAAGIAKLVAELTNDDAHTPGELGPRALVEMRGGRVETRVGRDTTSFCQTLPAAELALGIWVEARRLQWRPSAASLAVAGRRAAEAVASDAERPDSKARIRLQQLVFQGEMDRPAATSALGLADDRAVAALHTRHYRPTRSVLTISGDFDGDDAMRLVRDGLGVGKSAGAAAPPAATAPAQSTERVSIIEEPGVTTRSLYVGWRLPPPPSRDRVALGLAAHVLAGGRTSRLEKELVGAGLASRVETWITEDASGGLLGFRIDPAPGRTFPSIQQVLSDSIRSLGSRGPTAIELGRAKARARIEHFRSVETNAGRARRFGLAELTGDARRLGLEPAVVDGATAASVGQAARAHLGESKRCIIELHPPSPPEAKPASVSGTRRGKAGQSKERTKKAPRKATSEKRRSRPAKKRPRSKER